MKKARSASFLRHAILIAILGACSGAPQPGAPKQFTVRGIDVTLTSEAIRRADNQDIDLAKALRAAVERASDRLGDLSTKITVGVRRRVIPETGMNGFTDTSGAISFWLGSEEKDLAGKIERYLLPSVAHELHHAKRIALGVGRLTLLDSLVTEGLADAFAKEVAPDGRVPWTEAIGRDEETRLWKRFRVTFTRADHDRWFFGVGDIPRWAGYTMGFHLVTSYLTRTKQSAVAAAAAPAKSVLCNSNYPPAASALQGC